MISLGIQLPAELRDVAAQAGARWPEADEDAMRTSAAAWRTAAKSVGSLARNADSAAQGALGAIEGETAQAARKNWEGFVAPDAGKLPASAKECTAAADRLEHAADEIGKAKVHMVRELVSLAKTTDAAHQVAASGNPQALAGVNTAVRGASANLAQVHNTLASAVDQSSGGTMGHGASPAGSPHGPLGTVTGAAGHTLGAATESAQFATGVTQSTVDTGQSAGHLGGLAARATEPATAVPAAGGPEVPGNAGEAVRGGRIPAEVPGLAAHPGGWKADSENTGPLALNSEAGTGPLPIVHGSHTPAGPQAVQQAWAAAPAQGPAVPPSFAGPPAPPGYAGQQGYAGPQGYAGQQYQVGQFAPPADGAAGSRATAGPRPPVAAPGRPPAGGAVYGSQPPQQTPQQQAPRQQAPARPSGAAIPPAPQPKPAAAPKPAPSKPMPPAAHPQPQAEAGHRPLKQAGRSGPVVAFVLHQFPIGHMPVAASRPSRQLPTPAPEADQAAGLRFPPQDHPRSAMVSDADAIDLAKSGQLPRHSSGAAEGEVPAELTAAHDPFGEISELEWERRYVAAMPKTDADRVRYAWRAGEQFPEGCVEPGEAIILEPGTVIDRFGDEGGRVFAADGTAFAQRALPPDYAQRGYRRYRVQRRLPVWQGVNAPWFAQPGGGLRFRTTYSAGDLLAMDYLIELTADVVAAEAPTLRLTVGDQGMPVGQESRWEQQPKPEQETGK